MKELPKSINGVPIPFGKSIDALKKLISSGGKHAWAAFPALAAHSNYESMELLKSYSKSKDWRIRRAAIESIALVGIQDANEIISKALEDESAYVVRAACIAVSVLSIESAHNRILKLLGTKNEAIRIAALETLSNIWIADDYQVVLQLFKSDPHEEVRKEAAWTLRGNVSSKEWSELFDLWKNDTLHRHRVWACELAYIFGSKDNIEDLNHLIADNDGHVRKAASEALNKISE